MSFDFDIDLNDFTSSRESRKYQVSATGGTRSPSVAEQVIILPDRNIF
jgi:hypothetical protein